MLRITVRGMASRDAVDSAIRPILAAAHVKPSGVRIDGSAVARATRPPIRRAPGRGLDSRRLPAGGWRDVHVQSPSGDALPLFVDPDRSIAQRRVSWYLSTATKAINALHPSLEITAAKSEGALTHRWEPIVRFTYNAATNNVIANWETPFLDRVGLDLPAIKKELARRVDEADAERRRRRG